MILVQVVINGSIHAWHLQFVVDQIREELSNFESFTVSHIRCGGNVEADVLLKWALSFSEVGDFKFEDF